MRLVGLVAVLCAGCFSPSFLDGKTPCKSSGECPNGFACAADDRCWRIGHVPTFDMSTKVPDGGPTPPDMAPLPDLAPVYVANPRGIWLSNGGGTATGPASGNQVNFSVGGYWAVGSSTGPATNGQLTSGFFCTDSIP